MNKNKFKSIFVWVQYLFAMIIIRLQLAVYNSGNVQVKRMEYFSRLGGYKRFVNHNTYRKTYFFPKQNGQKNTVINQGQGAEK